MKAAALTRILAPIALTTCVFALARGTCRAEFRPPDEKAIWAVWKQHLAEPDTHESVIKACRAFVTQKPADPYVVVARGLMAWHLLKAEQMDEANEVLTLLSQSPKTSETRMETIRRTQSEKLHELGTEMARRWLTRMDRENLRELLRKYYVQKVKYPRTLSELEPYSEGRRLVLRDRWNRTWSYRVSGYETVKDTYGQQYHLASPTLRKASSLAETLEIAYASRITLKPVKLFPSGGKRQTIEFTAPGRDGSIFLKVGTQIGGVFFAYEGTRLIVLSDGDHWTIVAKPRP